MKSYSLTPAQESTRAANVVAVRYSSALTDLCEANSSFDKGTLRIAYTGENRNGSSISREAFEDAIPSIYYCPLVCNYSPESDSFGGHDIALVTNEDTGDMRVINLTEPVGVVPAGAKVWFENVIEDNGTENEYLCAEVLLWKRQAAYQKLKEDGVTAQSMEINVKNARLENGVYNIEKFEFTAFALISVEPCFESASLSTYASVIDPATEKFRSEYSEMMLELKKEFEASETANLPAGDGNITHPQKASLEEGGIDGLDNEKDLEFTQDGKVHGAEQTIDEAAANGAVEDEAAQSDVFELGSVLQEALCNAVEDLARSEDCDYSPRYFFVDYDAERGEVYMYDRDEHWNLYGMKYTVSGDAIAVDGSTKKRMKFAIVEFDGGESGQPSATINAFSSDLKIANDKWQEACEQLESLKNEIAELREYKRTVEEAQETEKRNSVFAAFEDLFGNDAFEDLRAKASEYTPEEIEEKCYALRGRIGSVKKFSRTGGGTMKILVENNMNDNDDEPYGGVIARYREKQINQ